MPSDRTSSAEALSKERLRRARRLYLLSHDDNGMERDPDERAKLQAAERDLCAKDPIYWISNWGWLSDPHSSDDSLRVIPFLLWPRQREMLEWLEEGFRDGRDRHLNKARSIGASWGALHLILHHWLFDSGFLAKLGSRKEDFVDDQSLDSLFGKLRYIKSRQPPFLRPPEESVVDKSMMLVNNLASNEILGEATNKNFGRGGRRGVVLFDEFAHVDPDIQSLSWLSLETVARSRWDLSTPNGKGNRFHRNFITSDERDRFEIDWKANPARTQEWFDGLLIENGGSLTWDEREQEHACSFAGVSGYRIWKADMEKVVYDQHLLRERHPELLQTQPVVVGMDFGSGPSATVAVVLLIDRTTIREIPLKDGGRRVLPRIFLDAEIVRERTRAADIAREVLSALKPYGGRAAVVGDPAGIAADSDQESWEENLRSGGLPINCLPPFYNQDHAILETIADVQTLLDLGLLFINETCYEAVNALESWAWAVPRGMNLEMLSKDSIKPRKDHFSHTGDAIRYGVGFALRGVRYSRRGAVIDADALKAKALRDEPRPNFMPQKASAASRLSATLGAIEAMTGITSRRRISSRRPNEASRNRSDPPR